MVLDCLGPALRQAYGRLKSGRGKQGRIDNKCGENLMLREVAQIVAEMTLSSCQTSLKWRSSLNSKPAVDHRQRLA